MNQAYLFNFRRLVIVAYRLPFKCIKKGGKCMVVQNSGGLVSAILSLSEKENSQQKTKIVWIGTGEEELAQKDIHSNFELFPIQIPDQINSKYYGGFCNDTIWPLFHYFPSLTAYEELDFEAYKKANQIFMDSLSGILQPGDFVWVHDYHLFLLPDMIRQSFPTANIGFFLHIPFPSFEIFRLLPRHWREIILNGILGADIVGFHTNDYKQHFLKSVKRTLGIEINQNLMYINDRISKADAFPIGIDFDKFFNSCRSPEVIKEKNKLRNHLKGKKLIFSVDRLDYTKGFLYRLKAYERFLEKYPQWHQKAVFNMVVVPSRDHIERYSQIKKEIEATVGRINGSYSNLAWRPIIYQYKSLSFEELVALYDLSFVGLITPLRDGMNLVAKEYIASQRENIGMLVLSEMAGASVELNEAIIISPTDIEETADAIYKALEMPDEEKSVKIKRMQDRIARYNVFTWAADFFSQALQMKEIQKKQTSSILDLTSMKKIKDNYEKASKRIIFLDYDGTLIPIAKYPEMAILNEKARFTIKKLLADTKNKVVIISGRECSFIDKQFSSLCDLTLVAEHGYFLKEIGKDWVCTSHTDLTWKKKILPVLNMYVDRCNGSMIEEKHASLAWHFRNAEEDIASIRMHELRDDLSGLLREDLKLRVIEGHKVLEVKSAFYDKGTSATQLLGNSDFDFIMALGDDKTDEDLFNAIPEHGYTIKIGTDKPFGAKFNLLKQSHVYEFLDFLSGDPGTATN